MATKQKTKKQNKVHTIADRLYDDGGAGIANWADRLVKNDRAATLATLQEELEVAAEVLAELIDEYGDEAELSQEA